LKIEKSKVGHQVTLSFKAARDALDVCVDVGDAVETPAAQFIADPNIAYLPCCRGGGIHRVLSSRRYFPGLVGVCLSLL
jgi:hypothetical protein